MGIVKAANKAWSVARTGAWLTPSRSRAYLWLLVLSNAAFVLWLVLGLRHGIDRQGQLLGTDFVSFWAAGQVVQAGGNPYDIALHHAAESSVWPGQDGYTAFFYPPFFLLWCLPFGWTGYFTALGLWLTVSLTAWISAVRGWAGEIRWLALAAYTPLLTSLTHGQTSLLLAALLGGAFLFLSRGHGAAAGILFGLAAFKPQFGVLVPLVLLAARQWRAFGWAAATVIATGAATTMLFGPAIWAQWLGIAGSAQTAMADAQIGLGKMQSLFAALRGLGASTGAAYAVQLALAACVAMVVVRMAWQKGATLEVGALTLVGALLTTPFVLDYDFALLAFPLVLLAKSRPMPWERTVAAMAFASGAFARPIGVILGVPVAAVVIAALFLILHRRAAVSPA